MIPIGDFTTADTLYIPFNTYAFSTGASITASGFAVTDIEIYKDGSVTQRASDNGYALLDTDGIDFDSTTGLHGFSVDLSDNSDSGFYAAGSQYWISINAITVDGQTVVFVYYFTIILSAAAVDLANGTDGLGAIKGDTAVIKTTTDQFVFTVANEVDSNVITKTGFSLAATGLDAIASTATGMVEIAKAIWDRILNGSTHNIPGSSGKRLRQATAIVFADGVAQSAAANSITLAVGDVTYDNQFKHGRIVIIGGTGIGQEAIITSSTASTDTLTTTPDWAAGNVPDATSEYEVFPASVHSETGKQGHTGNHIFIDSVNGNVGTDPDINGTEENPVNSLADATTIAAAIIPVASKHFSQRKGSTITLGQAYSGFIFNGLGGTVILNGKDISLCTFISQIIQGVGIGTVRTFMRSCRLSTASLKKGAFVECAIDGTFTVTGTGAYNFLDCNPFDSSVVPTLDMGAAVLNTNVEMLGWEGPIIISNLGAAGTDTLYITGAGEVTLDASCVGGTLTLANSMRLVNNGSGVTVGRASNYESDLLVDDIMDEDISKANHNVPNSLAKIVRQGGDIAQIDGAVSDVSPATTGFDTTLTQGDTYFNDALLVFSPGAANEGIGKPISGYVTANGRVTFDTPDDWPETPLNGDDFIIYGIHVHPVAQIADAVLDEDMTGHQTSGTLGAAIGDPGASSETIFSAVVTDAAGANIAADIIVLQDYADAQHFIDTGVTPWAFVLIKAGTGGLGAGTELLRQPLKDVSGNNITNTTTVIGQRID